MTIVQVLTQQVKQLNKLEVKWKKKKLFQKTEADCSVTIEALKKEKEILEQKEKAFEEFITSQKKKAAEEAKLKNWNQQKSCWTKQTKILKVRIMH